MIPHKTPSSESFQWACTFLGARQDIFRPQNPNAVGICTKGISRLPYAITYRARVWCLMRHGWDWSFPEIVRTTQGRKTGHATILDALVREFTPEEADAFIDECHAKYDALPANHPLRTPNDLGQFVDIPPRKFLHGLDCRCTACSTLAALAYRIVDRNPSVDPLDLEKAVRPFVRTIKARRGMLVTA